MCTSRSGVWDVNRKIVAVDEALGDFVWHMCLWVERFNSFGDWDVIVLKRARIASVCRHHGTVGCWYGRAHGNICSHW